MAATLRFLACYLWEILVGALRIAWDVFTPGMPTSPGVVAIEAPPLSPLRRLLLANLVSMTPGSISVAYDDRDRLLVHLLYCGTDAAKLRRAVAERYLPMIEALPIR